MQESSTIRWAIFLVQHNIGLHTVLSTATKAQLPSSATDNTSTLADRCLCLVDTVQRGGGFWHCHSVEKVPLHTLREQAPQLPSYF